MSKRTARFSGHQTFSFRYGWLEKGFRFVKDNKWFIDPDAIVDLGVGKNMVNSIRYWCEMTGIISDGALSEFGQKILDEENGWDPFLEDNASLWLIHWKLNTNPLFMTSGIALFSFLHQPEFSKHDVAEASLRSLDPNKKAPSDSILLRDIDCYIRSYAGSKRFDKSTTREESFECPLQELNLIHPMIDSGMYRFSIGSKVSLPAEVIGFAVFEYLAKGNNRSSMRIQEALYHEFSPGQVFMLDENALIEAIQILHTSSKWQDRYSFSESAGVALIHCNMDKDDAYELLDDYFKGTQINA